MTREEAAFALEEVSLDSQAASLTSATIEITTDFTIGAALADAAQELRERIASQLPCAEVTLGSDARVEIEYGVHENCEYEGRTLSGRHIASLMVNETDEVVVNHRWVNLSDGRVELDGEASATWSAAGMSRTIEHELTWRRVSDGMQGVSRGMRTQRPHPAGLRTGMSVDGTRTWESDRGDWMLDIEGIEMRWIDPVPESGTYTLTIPSGDTLSMSFERAERGELHPRVTVVVIAGLRAFTFEVATPE